MKWEVSEDQPIRPIGMDQGSHNAALYNQLQANEGTWFDLDLSAYSMPDQAFACFMAYAESQLASLRGTQTVEYVEATKDKPYRVRLVSGLNVPRADDPGIESLESIRKRLAAILGYEPTPGLEVRMSGENLSDPKAVIATANVIMMDLNAILKKVDALTAQHGLSRIVPGLGRHYQGAR